MSDQDTALPVTVIGGYLGAGKTTLVNHVLRNADGLKLAILVNEFGDLPIDEDLIEAEEDNLISIAGGCVCCSFGSDLTGALMEMAKMDPRPDHLMIESSGVAIPSAIVGSVSLLDGFQVDGVVILADAETIRRSARDKYMADTVLRQLTDADIIVLNKTDLVDADHLSETRGWLDQVSSGTRVVEAEQGVVTPAILLDSFIGRKSSSGPHHHTANFDMMTLDLAHPRDVEALARSLADKALGLVRAKGFATSPQGQQMLVQVVGNRWTTSPAPKGVRDGIVCLGFKGVMSEEGIRALAHAG